MKKLMLFALCATLFSLGLACQKSEAPASPPVVDPVDSTVVVTPTPPAAPTDFVIYEFDGQASDTFWVAQPVDFHFVSVSFLAKSAKTGKTFWLHSTSHALDQHYLAGLKIEGRSFSHNSPPFCQMNETVAAFPTAKGEFYEAHFDGSFADSSAVAHVFSGKFRVDRTF